MKETKRVVFPILSPPPPFPFASCLQKRNMLRELVIGEVEEKTVRRERMGDEGEIYGNILRAPSRVRGTERREKRGYI